MAGLRRVKESIRGGVELCKGGRQEVEKIKPWGALGERKAFGDEGGKVAIRKRWQRKMGRRRLRGGWKRKRERTGGGTFTGNSVT